MSRSTNLRRGIAALAVATAATATLALGTGSASAVTGGTYCGATQQVDGDVYAQVCLNVSGYAAQASLHVTNHGSHSITGVAYINHNGSYEATTSCGGMTASDPGSYCSTPWDYIGNGGYAQGQAYLYIDGSYYGRFFSPSEYIG
ncbi:hypothetical protein [Kitasatospora viridis]|uniref:Spore-associated protein A n=1 Tax=Kitasatospora viridis TaxID=281105 RepID=A0A561SEF4_9ACTN|nr:hypothetical protein [Kitasatospora viridis]TWF73241.1 hypothetical protein FHX73_16392 [Kitasatospora viridis]